MVSESSSRFGSEEIVDRFDQSLKILGLTFPYHKCLPTKVTKFIKILTIPRKISIQFVLPKLCIAGWSRGTTTTIVSMPKTPVDEDHLGVTRKDDIRIAR